ncbi:HAD family hydrolase [Roseivirga sp. BDSF3-8]|uniref:HAD family hydrolase n=1 Tax=Roseivirga sp. BDSF3-8 TaxID=3241598 RepID=UPI0035323AC9
MSEPVRMAVFDLNSTVYSLSSKEIFFKFVCFRRNYKLINIFHLGMFKALGKFRMVSHTEFKENFFNYLNKLPPKKVYEFAADFWRIEYPKHFNKNLLKRIDELRSQGVAIVFATGALEVYAAPLFDNHLKVDAWVGTRAEYENGTYKVQGKACKQEEKTRRIREHYHERDIHIVEAYSDDVEHMFQLAEVSYLVNDGEIERYEG